MRLKMNPVSVAAYPDPELVILNASMDPDTVLPETAAFVLIGIYEAEVNLVFAAESTEHMYFHT